MIKSFKYDCLILVKFNVKLLKNIDRFQPNSQLLQQMNSETGCQKFQNSVNEGVDYWVKIYLLEEFNNKFYQYQITIFK